MILNAYIFKKNMRIYYANYNNHDKMQIAEMTLGYDLSNEHNVVKVYVRANNNERVALDIICN